MRTKRYAAIWVPMLCLMGILPASHRALAAPALAQVATTIKQKVEGGWPGVHVLDVQPAAIPGLYEVFTGDQIVYADVTGDYLIMGPLVETAEGHENLTRARLNERGRINFATLPLNRAIKVVKGNGARKFAVFSDPDCPFCQALEKNLVPMTDYTMYVFLYPIASLHPNAPAKAHTLWCAKDRAGAWSEWMHQKKLSSGDDCKGDPVDELQKLGQSLHIDSTPTIFFADGRRVAGAIPQEELEKNLAAASGALAAAPAGASKK